MKLSNFMIFLLQHSNAGWNVSLVTLPSRHPLSPASRGNMQKGVIIWTPLTLSLAVNLPNFFQLSLN